MKTLIKKFFDNEILSYLFFGVATTLVSVGTRLFIYHVSRDERLATAIGNIAGILFAFATNYIGYGGKMNLLAYVTTIAFALSLIANALNALKLTKKGLVSALDPICNCALWDLYTGHGLDRNLCQAVPRNYRAIRPQ